MQAKLARKRIAMTIKNSLAFVHEIDQLKDIERKTLNYFGGRMERSGEHSWHLATAVMVFHPYAKDSKSINIEKAIKMALIHDIVEIDAGDTIAYEVNQELQEAEEKAAERLFGLLGEDQSTYYLQLWKEFESRESAEAKYVKSLDRFLPLYSNCLSGGQSWKTHNISLDQIINLNKPIIEDGMPDLWPVAYAKILEIAETGILAKKVEL